MCMEIRPSMILISCVFGLISMVAIGDMVSPADADYGESGIWDVY
jgi:hypothetical protein